MIINTEDILRQALEEISDPIKFMKDRLKEGERLDGSYAIQLSNDSEYLKSIANKALSKVTQPSKEEGNKFKCFEIHTVQARMSSNGCSFQCKECSQKEQTLNKIL